MTEEVRRRRTGAVAGGAGAVFLSRRKRKKWIFRGALLVFTYSSCILNDAVAWVTVVGI